MKERLKSKKGFTLAELLIVVAIIAVLVAIMIPVFGSSRESAILSKDAANIRAAYAEAVVNAMTENAYDGDKLKVTVDGKAIVDSGTHTEYKDNAITVWRGDTSNKVKIPVDSDITLAYTGTES